MADIILGEMDRWGRIWGRSVRVSRLRPWEAQERDEQARRVIWLPSGLLIWDSLCKREEPVSVGVAFDPQIHASMSHKRCQGHPGARAGRCVRCIRWLIIALQTFNPMFYRG